jgi:23S rRNA pseudouridine1911/1915/1917 synthase
MTTTVTEEYAGMRLDSFVTASMPRLSRAYAQVLCDTDRVRVNEHPRKSGYKLHFGDDVIIEYDEKELDIIPDINLPILYEDDDCVVINKPTGVLTHTQGAFNPEATVASFLRGKINGEVAGLSERAGVVHRLDRATSGVMIGAKNQEALSWLQKQFAQRKVHKTYIAVVEGHPAENEAIIDMPIERNPKAPATFRVGINGKDALTRYKVLQQGAKYSLLELKPETGRTHQLRVHLQKIGHPIVGDPLYGSGKFGDRLFLHAVSLEITLPSRERKTFEAPLPSEFEEQANA